jgi:DNA-binding IclR family transcriptional regulator
MKAFAKFDPLAAARETRYRDSIEFKLLEFFDRNPDEELAATDVVLKYGSTLDTAAKMLRSLRERGLLEKRRDGRLHLYRRAS